MERLRDHPWQISYNADHGNLLNLFYVPLLKRAKRYDRGTGFYSADILAAAVEGVEALVANDGHMRLLVGCTLDEAEVDAICAGEKLKDTVEAKLLECPFDIKNQAALDALELLAWMVAKGYLEIKVAVTCDPKTRKPIAGCTIYHEKAGIVEDAAGDRLAFYGSLNETVAGWQQGNWEAFHVYCSWLPGADYLDGIELSFQKLWADRGSAVIVMGIGQAVKERLLQFLPKNSALPKRLAPRDAPVLTVEPAPAPISLSDRLQETWSFIAAAPASAPGGQWVGQATAAIDPWPHQEHAFCRMYENWAPRLLIADEVGLGKTIQAGLLIRQA